MREQCDRWEPARTCGHEHFWISNWMMDIAEQTSAILYNKVHPFFFPVSASQISGTNFSSFYRKKKHIKSCSVHVTDLNMFSPNVPTRLPPFYFREGLFCVRPDFEVRNLFSGAIRLGVACKTGERKKEAPYYFISS